MGCGNFKKSKFDFKPALLLWCETHQPFPVVGEDYLE